MYNEEQIIQFCLKDDIRLILNEIKWLWRDAIVYSTPSNIIEIRVYGDDVNISQIWDIIIKHHHEWNRDSFMKGRYGFFITCTDRKFEKGDILL